MSARADAPPAPQHRLHVDRRTARKAARVSIATTTGLLVGRYVFDDPQVAVFAAMGAIALLGLADFGGPLARRARSYAIALAIAAPLVAAGTLVSEHTVLASCSLFVVAFLVVLAGSLGRNAAVGGNAIILFFLVAAGIPAETGFVGARLVGLAIGGACSIVAAVALWPDRPGEDFRARLAGALDELATAAGAIASGARPAGPLVTAPAVASARPSLAEPGDRPSSPTDIDRAELFLVHAIPRIAEALDRLAARPAPDGPPALGAILDGLIGDVPRSLQASAAVLRGGPAEAGPDPLAGQMRAARTAAEAELAELLGDPENARRFTAWSDRAFTVNELAAMAVLAGGEARIAAGQRPDAAGDLSTPQAVLRGRVSRLRGAVRRLRGNLTTDSVVVRNALRLAAGLGLARFVAGEANLQHGFWVSFAVLGVMRTSVSRTGSTALQAIAGTTAGALIGTALLHVGEKDSVAYTIMLPIVIFAAFYVARYGFWQTQAGFTVVIMILFSITTPPEWTLGLLRIENVGIGLLVGLAIGAAVWPRGAASQLGRTVGAAALAAGAYAAAVAQRLLAAGRPGDREAAVRASALQSAGRAEDVFAAYRGEAPPAETAGAWGNALATTERLWYSADVLSGMPPAPPSPCGALAARLSADAAAVAGRCAEMEACLRTAGPPPERPRIGHDPVELGPESAACVAAAAGGSMDDRRAVVRLFAVRSWLGELAATAARLEAELRAALSRPAPAD